MLLAPSDGSTALPQRAFQYKKKIKKKKNIKQNNHILGFPILPAQYSVPGRQLALLCQYSPSTAPVLETWMS